MQKVDEKHINTKFNKDRVKGNSPSILFNFEKNKGKYYTSLI